MMHMTVYLSGSGRALPSLMSRRRISIVSCLLALALVTACGSGSGSTASTAAAPATAVPVGATAAGGLPPLTDSGGKGQPVDGIQCTPEMVQYHIHAHLTLLVDGQNIAIPAGIGITPPRVEQQGFVVNGTCFYWLHTHDTTGVIHVESPTSRLYTLGQFFDIWGMPLTPTQVATFPITPDKPLQVFVDGQAYDGSPNDIELTAHKLITLEVGTSVPPPGYNFPPGL
jgi:hypothetical protein